MPTVTIRTGIATSDGREETLSEYICDYPRCANAADQVIGVARELGSFAVCSDHAAILKGGAAEDSSNR
jgi:hypothetical protein